MIIEHLKLDKHELSSYIVLLNYKKKNNKNNAYYDNYFTVNIMIIILVIMDRSLFKCREGGGAKNWGRGSREFPFG